MLKQKEKVLTWFQSALAKSWLAHSSPTLIIASKYETKQSVTSNFQLGPNLDRTYN